VDGVPVVGFDVVGVYVVGCNVGAVGLADGFVDGLQWGMTILGHRGPVRFH
jgi:hypothetical protein